ncbi:MAG TPA: hypothetical protein VF591_05705 [Pyrinomonadaceae bacterium]|jgi:hypothetical protein
MLDKKQAEEILRALSVLPPDKVAEAQDFILFLRARYGQKPPLDESDAWSDEDLRDVTAAAAAYAEQSLPE